MLVMNLMNGMSVQVCIYTYVYTEMLGWEDEFCDLWKMWKGDEGGRRNGEMKERRVKAPE